VKVFFFFSDYFAKVLARYHNVGNSAGYAGTKSAIETFAKAAAVELVPKKVTVNVVAPGKKVMAFEWVDY
jgi:NAD(P)-dependent dehydrogenase (short-subunit alcohol dehydrogenase family)